MTDVLGDLARQMANAPTQMETAIQKAGRKAAAKAERKASAVNPIAEALGAATFRLNANPRWYPDRAIKNRESLRLAFVDFTIGAVVLSASVYLERNVTQGPDGRRATTEEIFRFPKGLAIDKSAIGASESFKVAILDAFDAWRKKLETGSGGKLGTVVTRGRVISRDELLDE